MASFGPITVSGVGHAIIGPNIAATSIYAVLNTPGPNVQVLGTVDPRSVRRVGAYGLGSFPDDSLGRDPAVIFYERWMRFYAEELPVGYTPWANAFSVWWRLTNGTLIDLTVNYC